MHQLLTFCIYVCIGNIEFILEATDFTDSEFCFIAAGEFSEFINSQGDDSISTTEITPDPVVSFLTAASALEQEEAGGSTTNPGGSGASQILPPTLLLLTIITALLFA